MSYAYPTVIYPIIIWYPGYAIFQLNFSQLFHFINMFLFNEVVTRPELKLCCHHWGVRIRLRLSRVEAWAEKQGLELAAECHLARVTQAGF